MLTAFNGLPAAKHATPYGMHT